MASNRIGRINEEIQRELAQQLRLLKDPRVQKTMVSITHVETTPDLRYAKVYVSLLDRSCTIEVLAGLKSSGGFLRRALALRIPGFFRITGRAGPGMGGATGAQGQQAHGKGYQQSWDKTHAFSGVRNRNQKRGEGPGRQGKAPHAAGKGTVPEGDRTTAGQPALPQGHTKLGLESISTGCCQV